MSKSSGMFDYLRDEMREAEKESAKAADGLRARNFILICGLAFVPTLVLVLIISLLLWDAEANVPAVTYYSALTMPLTGMVGLVISLALHRGESIWLSGFFACLPLFNLLCFVGSLIYWLIAL